MEQHKSISVSNRLIPDTVRIMADQVRSSPGQSYVNNLFALKWGSDRMERNGLCPFIINGRDSTTRRVPILDHNIHSNLLYGHSATLSLSFSVGFESETSRHFDGSFFCIFIIIIAQMSLLQHNWNGVDKMQLLRHIEKPSGDNNQSAELANYPSKQATELGGTRSNNVNYKGACK